MLAESIPYQRRTIAFRSERCTICCLQQFLIENNLNRFHLWMLLHSIVHSSKAEAACPGLPFRAGIRLTRVYNPSMRLLFATSLLALSAFAQTPPDKIGLFTESIDIGASPLKGSAEFDPATGEYKITGSGADIWGRSDQFHFLGREISGDFAVTATARFLTDGISHRKAVIMLRKSTDPDAAYVDLALHGDGTPVVQFRTAKGDTTNTVDLVTEGPGVWKLKLLRQGSTVTFWAAKDGAPLRELGHTTTGIGNPVLLGLGVSSHSQTAINTVVFSNVSIDQNVK